MLTALQGLDLARLADKGLFAYIDGLSELFYAPAKTSAASTQPGAIPIRSTGPAPTRAPQPAPGPEHTSPKPPTEPGAARRLHFSGNGTAALDGLERDIVSVINQLKSTGDEDESEVVLIVDQPDLLLAATGPSRGIGATEMTEWVMGLQQVSLQSGYV
jgi:elongator complex protein 6